MMVPLLAGCADDSSDDAVDTPVDTGVDTIPTLPGFGALPTVDTSPSVWGSDWTRR